MMINYNLIKCGFLGAALTFGLTACSWDMQRHDHVDTRYVPMEQNKKVVQQKHKAKPVQKSYASKDPTQKATPGPVRKAAPQIPVIQ
ncbi:hypothetical protein [Legionella rowbothamii]|uniref:hypothetical protein n=1 Tax=Legionella rowbothamii TaxID=96229 RepID=UPI001F5F558D|nr:hypothetical protein [Legionella rowbothamii]